MIHKAKNKLESLTSRGMKLKLLHVSLNTTVLLTFVRDIWEKSIELTSISIS